MEKVQKIDLGGKPVNWVNVLDKDVISYLSDINPDLGTIRDPKYKEFEGFLDELDEQKVEMISSADISYEDDLSSIDTTSNDVVEHDYARDDIISLGINIIRGILGSREKPVSYYEMTEQHDKETNIIWGVGKANLEMLSDNYNIRKKTK